MSGRLIIALAVLARAGQSLGIPPFGTNGGAQNVLQGSSSSSELLKPKLHGRFLHITDIHPDPFYKLLSEPNDEACHRGKGVAGFYGAETTDCDSPLTLVNATFDWIKENLRDKVDFVVWTGDSARHDNDVKIPRNSTQVLQQNQMLVEKMHEVFGKHSEDETSPKEFNIPIVPTYGNNDILPHNIFAKGPNEWTMSYMQLWRDLIPEEQRHAFERGGWFYKEVIPNRLAVISLNTLYFFEKNAAVDGCADVSDPGYEHMEWLRVQLQLLRERGMKAMIIGHVPPARTSEKEQWTESCWQKYTLWMRQYRDIVVGSFWGHMNIEHFLVQDFEAIEWRVLDGQAGAAKDSSFGNITKRDDFSIAVKTPDYLTSLRDQWSGLPLPPDQDGKVKGEKKSKHQKYLNKIHGEWAERFSISFVSASVVPNFFPTMRVFEYNISGLNEATLHPDSLTEKSVVGDSGTYSNTSLDSSKKHKKKKKKPKFTVPLPPSDASPPGPAYSPQALSLLGYTQYYANLTRIHHEMEMADEELKGKKPKSGLFKFEVEYDTRAEDDAYQLSDGLTVRNMVELAATIGKYDPDKDNLEVAVDADDTASQASLLDDYQSQSKKDKEKKKRRKKKKKEKRKHINELWYAFVQRAEVSTVDSDDLHDKFGQ